MYTKSDVEPKRHLQGLDSVLHLQVQNMHVLCRVRCKSMGNVRMDTRFVFVVRGPLALLPVASSINSVALVYRISAVLSTAVNTLGNVEHHLNRQWTRTGFVP